MKKLFPFLLVTIMLFVSACGGSENTKDTSEGLENLPSWYTQPPDDNDEFLYAVSSAVSSRREIARRKANTDAKANLAQKLGTMVENMQKQFSEEITAGEESNYSESFTNATKTVTNQELTGVTTENVSFQAVDNETRYECFVLAKLPVGEARAALENALSKEEEMYVKFKESKAFKEMQNDISRYYGEKQGGGGQ